MITREMLKNRPNYSTELTPDNICVGMTVRVKTVEQLNHDCPNIYSSVVCGTKYRGPGVMADHFIKEMIPLCGYEFEIDSMGYNNSLLLKTVDSGQYPNVGVINVLLQQYHFYPDWLEIA